MTCLPDIEGVTAHYGPTMVLEDLSLHVARASLVSLLGASGCGKTTTLRLVAGFLQPTSGRIRLGGKDLTRLPAHKRDIGLVFQTYALFPHLSVRDNVAFGLKQRGQGRSARRPRPTRCWTASGSQAGRPLARRLSGGQRQRVALARALVIEPPPSDVRRAALEPRRPLRVDMRVEIRRCSA
jgi:putative spermidine/putrescine transport system ATP-binding protein